MAELPSRKRQIIKRAIWTGAALVLLLAWYVSGWVLLPRAALAGWISWSIVEDLEESVYAPMGVYVKSDWPGASLLDELWWEVNKSWSGPLRRSNITWK